jgi:hypothetical protein
VIADDTTVVDTLCRSVIHCERVLTLVTMGTDGVTTEGAVEGVVVAHIACFTLDVADWVRACEDACATIEGGTCQAGFDGIGAAITATGFDTLVVLAFVAPLAPD